MRPGPDRRHSAARRAAAWAPAAVVVALALRPAPTAGEVLAPGPTGPNGRVAAPAAPPAVPALRSPAASPTAGADSPVDVDRILRRARAAYDSLQTLRARFRQVIEMQAFEPPRRRQGAGVWYQEKPGLFRMDFEEPEGDLVVSDGRALWLYYPSSHPGQVVRTGLDPDAAGRSGEIVDLQGRILERARVAYRPSYGGRVAVDGHPTHLVVLEPRTDQAAYAKVRLWIDAGRWLVRKLEFTDRSETVRTIVLEELETGVSLPDSLFQFEPPDDVEVFEG